jgi:predicted HD superfamily hydrolase involved in NAD metabolism
LQKLKALAREILGDYRYKHSLCVADSALELAKKYGVDPHKAQKAALLHDLMKDTGQEELLCFFEELEISLNEDDRLNPQIWHGMAAAFYLRDKLGIEDEDIFNAVYYHTTGRAGMSPLEKVIFVADYISDDRKYPDLGQMRKLAKVDLDRAIIYALAFQIGRLAGERGLIHPNSLECYNELLAKHKNKIDF